jgi:tetratricopeptide (TPR) repeat protein
MDRTTGVKRQLFGVLVLLFAVIVMPDAEAANGQTQKDLNWYNNEAENAITKENYEYAIKTLKEGIKMFPDSARLNITLGDLYYRKKFYELALSEYVDADKKEPDEYSTLNQIQRCYGYMNEEDKSIDVLKKILDKYPMSDFPASYAAVDDLGWMYYKTHRLEEGATIIQEALAARNKYDINKGLYMTLGTIYSGMYDYEKSKTYYLKAIKEATDDGDTYFASIAYYNLSLLEHNFYHFNSALLYTDEALRNENRATGHLAKGELYQSQMNYTRTMEEYQQGMNLDETPLTMINMAISNKTFGKLDTALSYSEKVLSNKDESWMLNFGTDVIRHKAELFRILAETNEGLEVRESLLPHKNIIEGIVSFAKRIWYALSSYYYKQKYKVYAVKIGKEYLSEKNLLDAYREFYNANEEYDDVALKYLRKAEEIETVLTPHSRALYLQEEGGKTKSVEKLRESLTMLDPFWEKESIEDTLAYLADIVGKKTPEGRNYMSRIFAINPGGLMQ